MNDTETQLDRYRPLNGLRFFRKQRFDLYASRRGLLNQFVGLKYFNVFRTERGP